MRDVQLNAEPETIVGIIAHSLLGTIGVLAGTISALTAGELDPRSREGIMTTASGAIDRAVEVLRRLTLGDPEAALFAARDQSGTPVGPAVR